MRRAVSSRGQLLTRSSRPLQSLRVGGRRCTSATASTAALPPPRPSGWQLRAHALTMGVPMIGFGFMDNLVMIQAGDLIDNSIGVTFGLATLTSAAYGQIVSDVTGTISSGAVEALASRLGRPQAELTRQQLRLRDVKIVGVLGAVVGVAVGCLLGMSCLLFMDLEKSERLKRQRELRTLYSTLMEEGHELIGAQHCALFLLDESASTDGELILTSMGWTGNKPTADELERTFRAYIGDTSSDKIDAPRLYRVLRSAGWLAELHDVEQMIATVDADHDKLLSFDEFCQLIRTILADEVRLKVRPGGSRHRVLTTGQTLNVRNVATDSRISDESRRRYAVHQASRSPNDLLTSTNQSRRLYSALISLPARHLSVPPKYCSL